MIVPRSSIHGVDKAASMLLIGHKADWVCLNGNPQVSSVPRVSSGLMTHARPSALAPPQEVGLPAPQPPARRITPA